MSDTRTPAQIAEDHQANRCANVTTRHPDGRPRSCLCTEEIAAAKRAAEQCTTCDGGGQVVTGDPGDPDTCMDCYGSGLRADQDREHARRDAQEQARAALREMTRAAGGNAYPAEAECRHCHRPLYRRTDGTLHLVHVEYADTGVCDARAEAGEHPSLPHELAEAPAVELDEDEGCEGHESLDGAHMGEAVYCDGSCRRVARAALRPVYVGHWPTGRTLGTVEQLRPDHAVVRTLAGRVQAFPRAELVFPRPGRELAPEDFDAARRAAADQDARREHLASGPLTSAPTLR